MRLRGLATDDEAVSPVIGVVLLVVISVILASIAATMVLTVSNEKPASQAAVEIAVDIDDDQVELTHLAGENLSADETRIVWEFDGRIVRSKATSTEQGLAAGQSTVFNFDGTTSADGAWSSYGSPGSITIEEGDQLTITLYDTGSEKPIVERTTTAGAVATDLDAGSSTGSGLIFTHDDSSGAKTTHEINWDIEASDSAEGSSLNNVEIRYPSSVDFPDVDSHSDIAAGVDEDGDGTIEDTATVECCPSDSDGDGDVDGDGLYQGYSGNPDTLRIEFQGNADLDAGETMIVRVQDVNNPGSSGSYTVDINIDGAQTETGTLEID